MTTLRTPLLLAALLAAGGPTVTAQSVDFGRQIRPLLADRCFSCHGLDDENRESEMRLDTRQGLYGPVESGGLAVVAGDPQESVIYQRMISEDESERMPPVDSGKKLSPEEIDLVRRWIAQGATWQRHWSFVPPARPQIPPVADLDWPRNSIDFFVLARLDREGLQPSPPADQVTLVRRVTYDLTGLPPTAGQIDAFLADDSADAYERLVDRLLASESYGEHMARYWLDAARYGDTHGLHLDNFRMMWPYRDWVINAFNQNMPFDQFTIEQLAGDLLPNPTRDQLIATGFNRCNVTTNEGGVIPEEYYVHYTNDRVATLSTVWMGLSLGCAKCHNHKFDPFEQKDFYQLFAFFNSLDGPVMDGNRQDTPPTLQLPTARQAEEQGRLRSEIQQLTQLLASPLPQVDAAQQAWEATGPTDKEIAETITVAPPLRTEAQRKKLRDYFRQHVSTDEQIVQARQDLAQRQERLKQLNDQIPTTLIWKELAEPKPAYVLIRGAYDKQGEQVDRRTPSALPPLPELPAGETYTRLHLARWLVSKDHPLTSRVIANRLWQQCFGTGIVETAGDFGSQGSPPSHPQLLDWLAVELRDNGWNIKRLQKLIVMSATYRQSSRMTPEGIRRDPQNRLLARGPRIRMDAEMIRDTALFASGLLVQKMGGPSVKPYQPPGIWEAVGYTDSNTAKFQRDRGEALYRRSIYTFWKRTAPPPTLVTLDAPSRETCTVRRSRTNTPLAALAMMNDEQFVEASRHLAQGILKAPLPGDRDRAVAAFRRVTCRQPNDDEVAVVLDAYRTHLSHYQSDPESAKALVSVGESVADQGLDPVQLASWTMVANMLLNLDETVTKY